jgi:hypothetical protein
MAWSFLHRLIFGVTVRKRHREFAKVLDGQLPTPEQQLRLGQMAADAFVDLRCCHRDPELVFALADAFHCLPSILIARQFRWSWQLIFLEGAGQAQ